MCRPLPLTWNFSREGSPCSSSTPSAIDQTTAHVGEGGVALHSNKGHTLHELPSDATYTDTLGDEIRRVIRAGATPRHVPTVIVPVADLPRTRSGKLAEIAVREIVHGRAVKNQAALANPEALELFVDIPELAL